MIAGPVDGTGKILVTGATGFIGRHAVAALHAQGRDLRVLVRRPNAGLGEGIEEIIGDIRDRDAVAAATRGVSTVLHLAGSYRGKARELNEIHVEGTARLIRALDKGTRVVYMSSTSVYGWGRDWPVDEHAVPSPASAYGYAKIAAERRIRGWGDGPSVVIRPTIVYGPGDHVGMLPRAHGLLSRGLRVLPGTGKNRIHLVEISDLISAMMLLIDQGSGTYVVAGPRAAPISEIMQGLATAAGVKAPTFAVPAVAARVGAQALENLYVMAGRPVEAPLTTHAIQVLTEDRAFDTSRMTDEFGWLPQVDLAEGLAATGAWLTKNPAPRTVRTADRFQTDAGGRPLAEIAYIGPDGQRHETPPDEHAVIEVDGEKVAAVPGPPWRRYFIDPDEGIGTVYERFVLADVIDEAMHLSGATSILHAPMFGMTGIPGLDTVFAAREGARVGLADVDPQRLAASANLWRQLRIGDPKTYNLSWPDTSKWGDELPTDYDLVYSFCGLWWCRRPFEALAAQARAAKLGVLFATGNHTPTTALRNRLWKGDEFAQLRTEAAQPDIIRQHAAAVGLDIVAEGYFDLPPFPDTSIPLRQTLMAARAKRGHQAGPTDRGLWRWSILNYLNGRDPDLRMKMSRLGFLERAAPESVLARAAHHYWVLFALPDSQNK